VVFFDCIASVLKGDAQIEGILQKESIQVMEQNVGYLLCVSEYSTAIFRCMAEDNHGSLELNSHKVALVHQLLDRGWDVNACHELYGCLIEIVSFYQPSLEKFALLRHLLSRGANVNVAGRRSSTAISGAVAAKDAETIKLLLSATPAPDLNIAGRHPENYFQFSEDESVMGDQPKFTPLQLAAGSGDLEIIKMLLEAGADLEKIGPRSKWSPLALAIVYDKLDTVHLLVRAGAHYDGKLIEHAKEMGRANLAEVLKTSLREQIGDALLLQS
jgi:ankyrin repeat protein